MRNRANSVLIVGRGYQRRAELLAKQLAAEVIYLPNRWKSKWLRPLDYLFDFFVAITVLRQRRPDYITVQNPPPYLALAAVLLRIPFVFDAHNAAIQGVWARVPGAKWLARKAIAVVAHNMEAGSIAEVAFPASRILVLRDPIEVISAPGSRPARNSDHVLFICSFGNDEPIALIYSLIRARPTIRFFITAPVSRLSPEWRERLTGLPNLELTGFLSTERYQELLLSVGAAIVLTTRPATQPSGACEALSSDTPLVLSHTSLTEALFGEWAHLAKHDVESLSTALDAALQDMKSLASYRDAWVHAFQVELSTMLKELK